MPFALADIVPILAALLLLMLAICAAQLLAKINSVVPDPSILGYHVFGWFHSGITDLHQWANDAAAASIEVLHDVITDTGWLFKRLASSEVSVIRHVWSNLTHVANVVVVDATQAAESFATDAANAVEAQAQAWYNDARSYAGGLATSLQDNIDRVIDVTIPQAVTTAFDRVEANLSTDVTNLQHNITSVANDLANDLAYLEGILGPLSTAVFSTIPAALALEALTEKQDNAATQAADAANLKSAVQTINGKISEINAEIGIQGVAIDTANQAIDSLDKTSATYGIDLANQLAAIDQAQGNIDSLTNQADGLQTQATAAQSQLDVLKQTQAITLPGLPDLAIPGSLVVPVAVAGLASVVADIATEIDRCMVTTCEGPNNILSLLNGVLGGVQLAELAAFLAAAVHDPSGEAKVFASGASGLYNEGHALIDDLLSI